MWLRQVAYSPRVLLPYSKLGEDNEVMVQDVSQFAEVGEELSFWQLQVNWLLHCVGFIL